MCLGVGRGGGAEVGNRLCRMRRHVMDRDCNGVSTDGRQGMRRGTPADRALGPC